MENEIEENKPQESPAPNIEDRPLTKREKRELAKEKKREDQSKSKFKSKFKKIVTYLLILISVGFGGYKLWQWINTPQTGTGDSEILNVKSDDWVKGNSDAKITIIEYADFECPACAIYSTEVMKKLMDEYKDDLRIVYRHFPLPQHKKAVDASKASEAAGRQGKFWEMHDLLYEKQDDWSTSGNVKGKLLEYTESLGINKDQYEKDFESDETLQSIKNDEAEGYALRINSTPTFYVNGKKASVNNGYEDLKKAIEQALGTRN